MQVSIVCAPELRTEESTSCGFVLCVCWTAEDNMERELNAFSQQW